MGRRGLLLVRDLRDGIASEIWVALSSDMNY
jgi:hypothetical protein